MRRTASVALALLALGFSAHQPPSRPFRFARGQSVYVVAVKTVGDAEVFSHCRPDGGPAPLRLFDPKAKELVPAGIELLDGGLPDATLRGVIEGLIRKFGRFTVAATPERADLVLVAQAVYDSWNVATARVNAGDGTQRNALIGSIGALDRPRNALANLSAIVVPGAAWRDPSRSAASLLAASVWQGVEVKVFGGRSTVPKVQEATPGSPASVLSPDHELAESWRRINVDPVSVEPMFKAFSDHPERVYTGARQPDRTSTQVQDDLRRQAGDRGFSSDDPFRDAIRNPVPQPPRSQSLPKISVSWSPCAAPQPARAPLGDAVGVPAASEMPAARGATHPDAPSFKSGVTAIAVPIVATGSEAARVSGLTAADFRVYEDDVEQEVAQLLTEADPLNVVLLLDASDSMRARVENERAAASALVDALRPEDAVMVASFAGRVLVHAEWTRDRPAAREAILRVRTGGRGSRLYDAMDVVFAERLAAVRGRKVMVVLTDGLDVDSEWASGRSVMERVQAAGVPVYVLQYDTSADPRFGFGPMVLPKGVRVDGGAPGSTGDGLAMEQATRFLDAVTRTSGGRVVRAKMPDEIARAFEGIADEVRQQLVLYYYPSGGSAPDTFHAIRVESRRPGVTIRTRTGRRVR